MRSIRLALSGLVAGALVLSALAPVAATAASGTAILSLNSTLDASSAANASQYSDTGFVQTDGQGGFFLYGGNATVELAPPIGQTFKPGVYTDVSNSAPTTAHAYGDISSSLQDHGFAGVIDVLDFVAGSNGVPTRFDIVLRTPGAQSAQGYFGEIRMGEDAAGAATLAARHLEWSPTPAGGTPITAIERVHNASSKAVAVGAPVVTGDAAKDWTVSADGCSGRTLAAGARCSFLVGFSPKSAGPRLASLTIPVGGAAQTVSLAGTAPLGTTRFTTSGTDAIDGGRTNTWSEGGSLGFYQFNTGCGLSFGNISPYGLGDPSRDFQIVIGPVDTPPTIGTHATVGCDTFQDSLNVSAFGIGFGGPHGTETVQRFDLSEPRVVADADVTFTITDEPGKPMTGHLQYRARSDYTAPSAPTGLSVSGRTVRWRASRSSDAVKSIARLVLSTAPTGSLTPTSGYPVSAGTATSAVIAAPRSGAYRVVVFAVDGTGNVSAPAAVAITG